jgi:hypothetical protein
MSYVPPHKRNQSAPSSEATVAPAATRPALDLQAHALPTIAAFYGLSHNHTFNAPVEDPDKLHVSLCARNVSQ